MRLIDSHCHVNAERFEGDADLVVGAARLAGLERILVPGWNVASSERALALAGRTPWLDAAVGVHPHDAAKVGDAGWERIVGWATDASVVAIGETGLDYDRVFSPIDDQLRNLRRNLALALASGKPAILHCRSAVGRRDAQDALLAELRATGVGEGAWRARFADRPPVIVHSFSGPVDYAQAMLDLGAAISF
ncbi:MAG: TatD family hydrolase, partial [Candidatus Limnocylindrales bacterium]